MLATAQVPPSPRRIFAALQGLLLRTSLTLAVGSAFRPVLLSLVGSLVDARIGGAFQPDASHAAVAVALISLMELAPHLERSGMWTVGVSSVLASVYCMQPKGGSVHATMRPWCN